MNKMSKEKETYHFMYLDAKQKLSYYFKYEIKEKLEENKGEIKKSPLLLICYFISSFFYVLHLLNRAIKSKLFKKGEYKISRVLTTPAEASCLQLLDELQDVSKGRYRTNTELEDLVRTELRSLHENKKLKKVQDTLGSEILKIRKRLYSNDFKLDCYNLEGTNLITFGNTRNACIKCLVYNDLNLSKTSRPFSVTNNDLDYIEETLRKILNENRLKIDLILVNKKLWRNVC